MKRCLKCGATIMVPATKCPICGGDLKNSTSEAKAPR